jgi:hypothetical protein
VPEGEPPPAAVASCFDDAGLGALLRVSLLVFINNPVRLFGGGMA